MAIELKLDKEGAEILQQVLEANLHEPRFEISNTDSLDYRSGRHEPEDRMKGIPAARSVAGTTYDLLKPQAIDW